MVGEGVEEGKVEGVEGKVEGEGVEGKVEGEGGGGGGGGEGGRGGWRGSMCVGTLITL